MKFNLNADMAEGYGPWKMGDDDGLLEVVKTANIACGFHGGDHNIMAQVMDKATQRGISIGSHPSFLDLHGFGWICIPSSVFCVVQPCRGLFFQKKHIPGILQPKTTLQPPKTILKCFRGLSHQFWVI